MKDSHTRLRDWEALLEDIDYVWLDRAKDTLTPKLKEILESTFSTELESIRKEIESLGTGLANDKTDTDYEKGYYGCKEDILKALSNRIQK